MTYDFDKIIDRTGTDDLKHGVLQERYGDANLLPLWVADMDFETPQFITDALRKRLDHSLFGYTMMPEGYWQPLAAFTPEGEQWRKQMLSYIEGNIDFVINYCRENIPQIKPWRPQASFLVWLDCRALGLNHRQLVDLFVKRARLALNDGEMFGKGGEGFMRLNIAAPRAILQTALERLKEVYQSFAAGIHT